MIRLFNIKFIKKSFIYLLLAVLYYLFWMKYFYSLLFSLSIMLAYHFISYFHDHFSIMLKSLLFHHYSLSKIIAIILFNTFQKPSVPKNSNLSFSWMDLFVISGSAIKPDSVCFISPNARVTAISPFILGIFLINFQIYVFFTISLKLYNFSQLFWIHLIFLNYVLNSF